jgi:hypothetical protein
MCIVETINASAASPGLRNALLTAANKFSGVRAVLCPDDMTAEYSRRHNDANVLYLPSVLVGQRMTLRGVEIWLKTLHEGGRHARRPKKTARLASTRSTSRERASPTSTTCNLANPYNGIRDTDRSEVRASAVTSWPDPTRSRTQLTTDSTIGRIPIAGEAGGMSAPQPLTVPRSASRA